MTKEEVGAEQKSEGGLGEFLAGLSKSISEREKAIEEGRIIQFYEPKTALENPVQLKELTLIGGGLRTKAPGVQLVKVRPCDKECNGKTYAGFYLGDVAIQLFAEYNAEEESLKTIPMPNPLIFVPDLMKCVYGAGSWWAPIESLEELKEITDEDIENVWYVKALKNKL